MTTPDSFGQFGQTLAFTERTMTRVLTRHLAERGIVPETWYALKLVATRGPRFARSELTADLEGSRALDSDSTRRLLDRLAAEGLIQGDAEVELTSDGEHLYEGLLGYVLGATVELLGQFDPDDIDTTVRTLAAITARAAEGLGAPV